MQISTKATTMWLAAVSAEFIATSKEEIQQDPHSFWPEEEGEIISSNWSVYPVTQEIYFEGEEEETYAGTEALPRIEVVVSELGSEIRAPEEVDELLLRQIMVACQPLIEDTQAADDAIAAEFTEGRGVAEIRSMDSDIRLWLETDDDEPVDPVEDVMLVLLSVSYKTLNFQHCVGIVLRGNFLPWEVSEGDGGNGFITDYYDDAGHRYMTFSNYGQGSDIEVY